MYPGSLRTAYRKYRLVVTFLCCTFSLFFPHDFHSAHVFPLFSPNAHCGREDVMVSAELLNWV